MLKYLLVLFSLTVAVNAAVACNTISISNTNPNVGQRVYFNFSPCSSTCYSCLGSHAEWIITAQGSFVISGTTYNGSARISGTGFNAIFNSNTSVTVSFSTSGNCSPCNVSLSRQFRVGPPPPPPAPTRPSQSLVDEELTKVWENAGADKSGLPAARQCINIHNEPNMVSNHRDGYRVNITTLNDLIRITPRVPNTSLVIYFQDAKYYFDKSETIKLTRNDLILSGEGADKTEFIIEDISTSEEADAISFITINGRTRVGVTCLSINTSGAFKSSYYHNNLRNGKFNAASIIEINSSNNCWVSGVQVRRGYGNTVLIARGSNNEVTNCFFFDHWTLGGVLGTGVQGYGVNISKSDNNLIENNRIGLSRHNIIIQGNSGDNATADTMISDGNVVAYNYLYAAIAVHTSGATIYPSWNITFHGGGKNRDNLVEGNVCNEKIAIDDVKASNGRNNTFYRNLSKTQIEIEKGVSCHNKGQKYLGNTVYKNGLIDRYRIRGDDHLVVGNRKCNSSGGNPTTGNFNVGDRCGFRLFNTQNKNTSATSNQLGQSCYLTSRPDFLSSFPYYNPDHVIDAKDFTEAPAEGCFTCPNVVLPPRLVGPGGPKDPKDPGEVKDPGTGINAAMKNAASTDDAATTPLEELEGANITAFPNPTADQVTIQINNASVSSSVVFQLFDVSGQMIASSTVVLNSQNSFDYDLSAIARGIYIGTITDNGKSYSVKIMKK